MPTLPNGTTYTMNMMNVYFTCFNNTVYFENKAGTLLPQIHFELFYQIPTRKDIKLIQF